MNTFQNLYLNTYTQEGKVETQNFKFKTRIQFHLKDILEN